MIDPMLLMELLDSNPEWEVRHLEHSKGIFIGPDVVLYDILECADLDLDTGEMAE